MFILFSRNRPKGIKVLNFTKNYEKIKNFSKRQIFRSPLLALQMAHPFVTLALCVYLGAIVVFAQLESPVMWAWVSGANTNKQYPVYGTKGVPSTSNNPGSRVSPAGYYDSTTKELWIFGGRGYTTDGQQNGALSLCMMVLQFVNVSFVAKSPFINKFVLLFFFE